MFLNKMCYSNSGKKISASKNAVINHEENKDTNVVKHVENTKPTGNETVVQVNIADTKKVSKKTNNKDNTETVTENDDKL